MGRVRVRFRINVKLRVSGRVVIMLGSASAPILYMFDIHIRILPVAKGFTSPSGQWVCLNALANDIPVNFSPQLQQCNINTN